MIDLRSLCTFHSRTPSMLSETGWVPFWKDEHYIWEKLLSKLKVEALLWKRSCELLRRSLLLLRKRNGCKKTHWKIQTSFKYHSMVITRKWLSYIMRFLKLCGVEILNVPPIYWYGKWGQKISLSKQFPAEVILGGKNYFYLM